MSERRENAMKILRTAYPGLVDAAPELLDAIADAIAIQWEAAAKLVEECGVISWLVYKDPWTVETVNATKRILVRALRSHPLAFRSTPIPPP